MGLSPSDLDELAELVGTIDESVETGRDLVSVQSLPGGVWNNRVLLIRTPTDQFVYKEYRDDVRRATNYSPPSILAVRRAELACSVQDLGHRYFADGPSIVPQIRAVARHGRGFLMDAVRRAGWLNRLLSRGACPPCVTVTLPNALAGFHNQTSAMRIHPQALDDRRFRDYKLGLQYNGMTHIVGHQKGAILAEFAEDYKDQQQCVVHGDLNSRNVLLSAESASSVHVIDFEQAHLGTAAFDVSYLLAELYIAAYTFPHRPSLISSIREYLANYFSHATVGKQDTIAREATVHLASQVLYRFFGPTHQAWTGHVDSAHRKMIVARAKALITRNPVSVLDLFN